MAPECRVSGVLALGRRTLAPGHAAAEPTCSLASCQWRQGSWSSEPWMLACGSRSWESGNGTLDTGPRPPGSRVADCQALAPMPCLLGIRLLSPLAACLLVLAAGPLAPVRWQGTAGAVCPLSQAAGLSGPLLPSQQRPVRWAPGPGPWLLASAVRCSLQLPRRWTRSWSLSPCSLLQRPTAA